MSFYRALKLLLKSGASRRSILKNLYALFKIQVFLNSEIIIIALTEHIGDIVACEPVSFYLRRKHPKAHITWVINSNYTELFAANNNIDSLLPVKSLGEWVIMKPMLDGLKIFDLHLNKKPCGKTGSVLNNPNRFNIDIYNYYNHGNLLQAFSQVSGLDIPNLAPKLHFDFNAAITRKVPAKYIAIHTVSNEESRCWDPEKWNELARQVLMIYPDLSLIEIGLKNLISTDTDRYIDYCGRLTFTEYAYVIEKAVFFIGIDSAFAHFANALKKSSAILMGQYRDFETYMPYSGFFQKNKEENIIKYNGPLKDLPVADVLAFVKKNIGLENPKNVFP